MIEAGARKLLDAASLIKEALPADKFDRASKLFDLIVNSARQWQESGEAQARKERYIEEHREVTTELTFGKRAGS